MSNLVPDDCIQCEIVLGGKLRNTSFVNSITEKATLTNKTFRECLVEYMHAFHKWEHVG